jgi:hypothetical protein
MDQLVVIAGHVEISAFRERQRAVDRVALCLCLGGRGAGRALLGCEKPIIVAVGAGIVGILGARHLLQPELVHAGTVSKGERVRGGGERVRGRSERGMRVQETRARVSRQTPDAAQARHVLRARHFALVVIIIRSALVQLLLVHNCSGEKQASVAGM